MNNKKWIVIWLLSPIFLTIIILAIIENSNRPLRFSNSISYDVKLNFIKDKKLLDSSNTIIIGSSIALNNINSLNLEDNSKKIKKIANLSSWALQTSEVLQLIKLVKLKNIDYLIYSSQYMDFHEAKRKDIDEEAIKKYLNNEFTLYPYITTIEGLMSNVNNTLRYDQIYLNPNDNGYLNYDRTGSVNFTYDKKYIKKNRWEYVKEEPHLSQECLESLIKLNEICQANNIKLIVITTPYRSEILEKHSDIRGIFNKYTNTLEELSKKHKFTYLNTHTTLNLSDKYFVDKMHLNKDGASAVSDEIIKLIKKL